jgi:hypothetical protein
MKALPGMFLCFGAQAEPGVVLLSEVRLKFLDDKMKVAETRCRDIAEARAKVYKEFFYAGVEYAIPAWVPDAMLSIVEHYAGPQSHRIRALAARLYEGMNFGVDVDGSDQADLKGGQPALIDPVKPKPKLPSGGARVKTPVAAAA